MENFSYQNIKYNSNISKYKTNDLRNITECEIENLLREESDFYEVLNTTNDNVIQEDTILKKNLKSNGSLICKNRIIDPICSFKININNRSEKYRNIEKYNYTKEKNHKNFIKNNINLNNFYKNTENLNKNAKIKDIPKINNFKHSKDKNLLNYSQDFDFSKEKKFIDGGMFYSSNERKFDLKSDEKNSNKKNFILKKHSMNNLDVYQENNYNGRKTKNLDKNNEIKVIKKLDFNNCNLFDKEILLLNSRESLLEGKNTKNLSKKLHTTKSDLNLDKTSMIFSSFDERPSKYPYDSLNNQKEIFYESDVRIEKPYSIYSKNEIEKREKNLLENTLVNKYYNRLDYRDNQLKSCNLYKNKKTSLCSKEGVYNFVNKAKLTVSNNGEKIISNNYLCNSNNTIYNTNDEICINSNFKENLNLSKTINELNPLIIKDKKNSMNIFLSKESINIKKFNSEFANDIDFIMNSQKIKNLDLYDKKLKVFKKISKAREKSSLLINNETNFNTCTLHSEKEILSGKNTINCTYDTTNYVTENKFELLKYNLKTNSIENNIQTFENGIFDHHKIYNKQKKYLVKNKVKENVTNILKTNENSYKKLIFIQKIFRGILSRKIFKKYLENCLLMNKFRDSFYKLFLINKKRQLINFFSNLKELVENKKREIYLQIFFTIINFTNKKEKHFKNISFRKIYLFSFTKKIEKDLEKEYKIQINKTIENKKKFILEDKKKNEIQISVAKFFILITKFFGLKMLKQKSLFLKRFIYLCNEINIKIERKIIYLKKSLSICENKIKIKDTPNYVKLNQKALFIFWKNLVQKNYYYLKMKIYLIKNIIEKKIKHDLDTKAFIEMIKYKKNNNENKKEKTNFIDKNNIYFLLIKESFNKVLFYFNNRYFVKMNEENKSNRFRYILNKCFFNKENVEKILMKKYLNRLKQIIFLLKKNEEKKKEIFKEIFNRNLLRNNILKIKSTINKWKYISKKILRILEILMKSLNSKMKKINYFLEISFIKFKNKVKRIELLIDNFGKLKEKMDLINKNKNIEFLSFFFQKFKHFSKWNKESNEIRLVEKKFNDERDICYSNNNILSYFTGLEEFHNKEIFSEKIMNFINLKFFWKYAKENKKSLFKNKIFEYFNRINEITYYLYKKTSLKSNNSENFNKNKVNLENDSDELEEYEIETEKKISKEVINKFKNPTCSASNKSHLRGILIFMSDLKIDFLKNFIKILKITFV